MWPFKETYASLRERDDMDDESRTGLISKPLNFEKEANAFRFHTGFALIHTIMAMLWLSVFWTYKPLCRQSPDVLRPLELAAAAEAVSYETVIFDISGGGTREHPITPYEGPPTPEKDMSWYELINVGMISLTPEMNKTLKHPTQPASKEDDTPLVELDVFHQLHCLNSIRNIVYGTNVWYNPNDRQDQIHVDHCLDYLRQVIMCHSDLTPITHKPRRPGFNPLLSEWQPQFAVPHTCRNFEKIHEWARRYNTSGFVIEPWPGVDPVAELRVKVGGGKETS